MGWLIACLVVAGALWWTGSQLLEAIEQAFEPPPTEEELAAAAELDRQDRERWRRRRQIVRRQLERRKGR